MSVGVGGQGYWGEVGGEDLCALLGRGQGGKGNLSRISAIELGMRLRGLDLEMQKER